MSSPEAERSFRNLVFFYKKELKSIDKGSLASDFFSSPQCQKLVKVGILEYYYVHRGCRVKLTNKTRSILDSYMSQVK